ncbi:unnamed protein product [Spirodela intermedia]|uniref:VQ domain-containing protein n=1 Tax=Spirodela intermedia TaxID=51605 RepID=A0A7I8KXG0_SPIIN|nr:unnamed protein product [Spirodela intermedia]
MKGIPERTQEKESPLLQTSPRTPTSSNSSTSTSNSTSNGGVGGAAASALPGLPLSSKAIPRSDVNPYPTTFVQADSSSFKQVVQMLTGSTETTSRHHQIAAAPAPSSTPEVPLPRNPIPPPAKTGPKRPSFKLYERRHSSFKNLKAIGPLLMPGGSLNGVGTSGSAGVSPRTQQPEILSPSILDFPALALSSPVTPLIPDPFNRAPHPNSSAGVSAEERAIAEKGFYLHPSPRATTPGDAAAPRLLPLFPVDPPRVSSGGPSTATSS